MSESIPGLALIGGALIGLSAALMIILLGRIAGISGILSGVWAPSTGDRGLRLLFLLGLPLGALLYSRLSDGVPLEITPSTPLLIVAGLLVGFGTRLGSGCTSGHGVCGLARGSKRSLAATVVFMATAALTVLIMKLAIG